MSKQSRKKDRDSTQTNQIVNMINHPDLPLIHKLVLFNLLFKNKELNSFYYENTQALEEIRKNCELLGYKGWVGKESNN